MAAMTDDTLTDWLRSEGFEHVVEHIAGDDMPPTDEYWILESVPGGVFSYLVNQDTAIPGRWRVASAAVGDGQWRDIRTDLTAAEAHELLLKHVIPA